VDQFNDDLRILLENLKSEAVAGGSVRKFAVGNATVTNFQTIYALVHCTPDLSMQECKNCLDGASKEISKYCAGKQGGRVIRPNCGMRFEVSQFYYNSIAPPLTNTNTTKGTPMPLCLSKYFQN
jgi:hypothetical protein